MACKIVKCVCGTEPVCERIPTTPVYMPYDTIQNVFCPCCGNTVSGEKGVKMWNSLMRVLTRNAKQRKYNKGEVK